MEDDDTKPYDELLSRQISEEHKLELGGPLTLTKVENSLFKDMKPISAPGLDGFTVMFLRTFWPVLNPLITAAVNEMKKKGNYSKKETKIPQIPTASDQ